MKLMALCFPAYYFAEMVKTKEFLPKVKVLEAFYENNKKNNFSFIIVCG